MKKFIVGIALLTAYAHAAITPYNYQAVTFDQIPGSTVAKQQLADIVQFLKNPKNYESLGGKMSRGVLLSGSKGNRRTNLVLAAATEAGCPVYKFNLQSLLELYVQHKVNPFPAIFDKVRAHKKGIILIDDFNSFFSTNEQSAIVLKDLLTYLVAQMKMAYNNNDKIIVIAKCEDISAVDKILLEQGLFETLIDIKPPTTIEREEILKNLVQKIKIDRSLSLKRFAINTQGFSAKDLAKMVNQAALIAGSKKLSAVTLVELEEARKKVVQTLNTSRSYFTPTTSIIRFNDIAGAEPIKNELKDVVAFLKNPDVYNSLGVQMSKGILFHGAPGNGKTFFAKALAGEADCAFFSVGASEFADKYVGVGTARVRELFEQARQHAPSIIFIDEIDSVGGKRNDNSTSTGNDQTLNQLLVEMDGFNTTDKPVIVIAATNRPDALDKALLRSGRFDLHIKIPQPDIQAREQILQLYAKKTKLSPEVHLNVIAYKTQGFAAADLANLMNRAALLAARKGLSMVTNQELEEAYRSLSHISQGH